MNVSGPGLPPAGGHVTLVPGPADVNGNITGLALEPADRAARSLSNGQWGKVQDAVKAHLEKPKNIDRLTSAAKGGDLPPGAMTDARRVQVEKVRGILSEHGAGVLIHYVEIYSRKNSSDSTEKDPDNVCGKRDPISVG